MLTTAPFCVSKSRDCGTVLRTLHALRMQASFTFYNRVAALMPNILLYTYKHVRCTFCLCPIHSPPQFLHNLLSSTISNPKHSSLHCIALNDRQLHINQTEYLLKQQKTYFVICRKFFSSKIF